MGGTFGKKCVIGCDYCDSNFVELVVPGKAIPAKQDRRTIYFGAGDIRARFIVEDTTSPHGLHERRVLLDRDENQILNLQDKVMSLHQRWQVYKGNSQDKKDLIFTVKQSKIMGSSGDLNVFLAKNKDKKTCNYRIRSSSDQFIIYDSKSHVIAKIGDTVKVHSKVDQAFIISLVTILNGINQRRLKNENIAETVTQGVVVFTSVAAAI